MQNKEILEKEFELCAYAHKLLNLLHSIEQKIKNSVDIAQVKKLYTMQENIMVANFVNQESLITAIL